MLTHETVFVKMRRSVTNVPDVKLVNKWNKLGACQDDDKTVYSPRVLTGKDTHKKMEVVVRDPETNGLKRVRFGDRRYSDYTKHHDKKRRANYCKRSKGIRCKDKECNEMHANFWSRMVLWKCDIVNLWALIADPICRARVKPNMAQR